MTDDELLAAFAAQSLDPGTFGHREHVRLVWLHLHLQRLPLLEAVQQQCGGLQRWTAALGVPGKYHATLTIAWVLLVADRMQCNDASTFEAFVEAHPDLLDSKGSALGCHYSKLVLHSPDARRHFVVPDRTRARPPTP